MTIQGMQQAQNVGPGTHRPLAGGQYNIPRTRSIVVEKGRSPGMGLDRQASDSP